MQLKFDQKQNCPSSNARCPGHPWQRMTCHRQHICKVYILSENYYGVADDVFGKSSQHKNFLNGLFCGYLGEKYMSQIEQAKGFSPV